MNAVGIDVSKGKSMVCVMRPFGEVVLEPFEVLHTAQSLNDLAGKLKALDGETRVVMEATGNYHKPVAFVLHDAGLFVSVVNPVLIHDYDNNSLRRVKTDRKDAVKIANYTLDKWTRLRQYLPEDDTRLALKNCYRQYQQAVAVRTMLKNNLISSLDLTFPDANKLFSSPAKSNGCEKWVDFIGDFWHSECVSSLSSDAFAKKYLKWCQVSSGHSKPDSSFSSFKLACLFGHALDLLVSVRLTCHHAYTPDLSTLSSLRGLTCLRNGKSHLEVGFTLRCLQRLSLPHLATQLCHWRDNWSTIDCWCPSHWALWSTTSSTPSLRTPSACCRWSPPPPSCSSSAPLCPQTPPRS